MVELLLAVFVIGLSGYAIGRTVGSEDLFDDFRARIEHGPYEKVQDTDGNFHYLYPEAGGSIARTGNSWFYATTSQTSIYAIEVEDEVTYNEDGEEVVTTKTLPAIVSPNFYRPGFFGFLRGKLGDLFTCAICLTGQACLWLGITYVVAGQDVLKYCIPLAAIGLGYIILALVSKLTQQPAATQMIPFSTSP